MKKITLMLLAFLFITGVSFAGTTCLFNLSTSTTAVVIQSGKKHVIKLRLTSGATNPVIVDVMDGYTVKDCVVAEAGKTTEYLYYEDEINNFAVRIATTALGGTATDTLLKATLIYR